MPKVKGENCFLTMQFGCCYIGMILHTPDCPSEINDTDSPNKLENAKQADKRKQSNLHGDSSDIQGSILTTINKAPAFE